MVSKSNEENSIKAFKGTSKKNASTAQPRTFKVVLIGDTNVGKTCLICRLCDGTFPKSTESTIGVDFRERTMMVDEEAIKLQLWDTAGQERFRYSMLSQYYRNVDAVVFAYDVTQKSSFENIPRWIQEFQAHCDNDKRIPHIVIGNKCDLHADRQVHTSEVKSLANHYGVRYWETSAKSDLEIDTVEVIFQSLAETLKLKTPLLDFPPAYSSVINLHSRKGLTMNQSIAASNNTPSQSMSSSERSRSQTSTKKSQCCSG